jgi:hypothetical protein
MKSGLKWLAPVAALCIALGTAVPARAQQGGGLNVTIDSDISFGTAAHDARGGGTIELDPITGARRTTGGLVVVGSTYFTGRARISGRPFARVRIGLPDKITMRARQGNKAVAAVFTASVAPVITLDALGQFSFPFAGSFRADEADNGEFKGNFAITADYE